MVFARPNELETCPYHFSLRLFTMLRRSKTLNRVFEEVFVSPDCLLHLGTDFLVGNMIFMRCLIPCGSTAFPWLVFFFAALLWGSTIYKQTRRWMWQGSASVVSWNWEKCSCRSKEEVRVKIQRSIGPHENLLTIVKRRKLQSCLPFIRSGQNHLARHSEREKKTRQTEEEMGRQHQGMDRPGVRQIPQNTDRMASRD